MSLFQRVRASSLALYGAAPAAYVGLCLAMATGCNRPPSSTEEHEEPAHVAHHVEEESLNTITLTARAAERLGIATADVQLVPVQRQRTVGGEVVIPPGKTIVVSSPLAGTLSAPQDGEVPLPGSKLARGQPVFNFTPLLTPERDVLTPADRVRVAQTRGDVATAQLDAERQVETARLQVEAAQITYDRAVQLLKDKAGSQRAVDEAQIALRLAHENLKTAETRHEFLSALNLDAEAGDLSSRAIESPVSGILQTINASTAETVAAGDPLFSVVQLDLIWIRVPVYVGELRKVDTQSDASVAEYGQSQVEVGRSARYVSAPPSANPNATSVDLFYELTNNDGQLYPGQKLAVTLPLKGSAESLVVPFAAVLYDIHGGAWVYEQVEPLVYARRRIAVEYVEGANAILAAGPEPGSPVVTDGAAELFGTEFGVGH